MSPLIRPATSAPIVPRLPGGALAPAAPGGALVRSPAGRMVGRGAGGAMTPWVQRITTGLAGGAAGIPGAALAAPVVVGAATLPWVLKNWRGGPGSESPAERRGLSTPTQRPIGNLPPSARVPSQYPAGVPTGVGGGNAGASTAAQWAPSAPSPAPRPQPSGWSPAAQQNPRLPAGRNVAIVNPRRQAENRALDQAAQNAGLPAWNWKAEENAAILKAAEERGQGAMAAREAQGGRGYITADNLPGTLDQSQAAYWQQADMQAWMNASEGNRKLAERAMARAGYNPQAAAQGAMPERMTTEDAILRAQAAGALDSLKPGATSDDAILAGQAAGAFDGGQINPAATQAATPGRMTTEDAILRAQGMGALDGLRPGATSDDAILAGQAAGAFDAWSNPADEQRQRAAALSNSYLRAIKQHGMGLG